MKVLLTRRRIDSERTTARLEAVGFEPIILPLFEIRNTGRPQPTGEPDFLIFTSAAAAETAHWRDDEALFKALPCYCVGPRTAEALAEKAYKDIRQGSGTAAGLAERIAVDFQGARGTGLYVCGEKRAFDFQARFSGSDVSIELWEVYGIDEANLPDPIVRQAIDGLEGGIVLLFSPAGTSRLLHEISRLDLEDAVGDCRFVAISDNCATIIPDAFRSHVHVARTADEPAMIEAALAIVADSKPSV